MTKPSSDVAICNLALDLLKEKPITIISSPVTAVESLCSRWYVLMRQVLLASYNWNFALTSAAINRSGTPSVSDYADQYTLPSLFLKLRGIIDPDIPLSQRKYEIQGSELLYDNASGTTLDIWYTQDMTVVSAYPSLFIKLFAEELAIVLGKKITVRKNILDDIRNDRNETRRLARAMDGQMRPPKRYESSRIVNAGLNPSAGVAGVAGDYEFDFDYD